jgi:carbamoyl-phosphate synthase large subunit
VIQKAEDREQFRNAMEKSASGAGQLHCQEHGRGPLCGGTDRVSRYYSGQFTLGGIGSGVAYNREEMEEIAKAGWMPA